MTSSKKISALSLIFALLVPSSGVMGAPILAEKKAIEKSVALPINPTVSNSPVSSGKPLPAPINIYLPQGISFSPPPSVISPYYIAVDAGSKMILTEKNSSARIEPASMTKVMTAYLVFRALAEGKISRTDKIRPVKFAEGSRMFLDNGGAVEVMDLLKGMIVQSGNDAAISFAIALSGSEEKFAEEMNAIALALGMTGSHFVNASGLPHPEHYSTARDMAVLALALLRDFPREYAIYSEREFTYNKIRQPNRNALLSRNLGVDGIKTGHTEAAGYCLMSSALRGDRRVVVVTAKAPIERERFADSEALINYVYAASETSQLFASGQAVEKLTVWKGNTEQVEVGFNAPLLITAPPGAQGKMMAKLSYQQPLQAPIRTGDTLGKLSLSFEGKPLAEYPVVALHDVGRASWLKLIWHHLRLMVQ